MLRFFVGLLLLGVGACASVPPPALPSPFLELHLPTAGSVYYANPLQVQGRAGAGAVVRVRLLDEADALVGEERITADATGEWATSLTWLAVADVPRLVTVAVFLGEDVTPLRTQNVLVAPLADRKEGTWAQIFTPSDGEVHGGDEILVEGVFSGQARATLTITLEYVDGRVISTQFVQHLADNALDAHLWRVDLATQGVLEPAVVRVRDADGNLLGEVAIFLGMVAG